MKKISQAVILAGGFGTRLKPFTDTNPKPMYPIGGKPFLYYLIMQVKSFGINDLLLLLGYMPKKIMDYFGDGHDFGVHIRYRVTPVEFETGFRLNDAYSLLDDTFLLLYCDNYCPINYERLVGQYFSNNALIQLTVYANLDGYTRSNLIVDKSGLVTTYDKKRIALHLSGVDIGYAIVNKKVVDAVSKENENFEAIVYPKLVEKKKLFATTTEHRYYSIGSWDRIELTKKFFSKQKYIFLDRDGTLNVKPPQACYVETPQQFIWLPGAKEAIKLLKLNNYKIILISNQPGIARGCMTEKDLFSIHQKMQSDLKEIGLVDGIDQIYYCPHNWNDGCSCRKPKPGLLFQAQKNNSLDLTKCYIIGDDDRDMEAGRAAGCKCIKITDSYSLLDAVEDILQDKEKCIND